MNTLKTLAIAVVAVTMLGGSAGAARPQPPVTLATDPAGDWTLSSQNVADIGAPLGQDLRSASIDRVGSELVFIIGVEDVHIPDPARRKTLYEWHFTVDGSEEGFVLYGPCTADPLDLAFYGCAPADVVSSQPRMTLFGGPSAVTVDARIDEAKDTISIAVPLAAIGARTGSVITDDTTDSVDTALRATPDENGSLTGRGIFIGDNLASTSSYRIART